MNINPAALWLRFDFPDAEGNRQTTFCFQPERVILARRVEDVLPALQEVQRATQAGSYAAGFVAYEAAPAFDPAMQVQLQTESADFPLLWFGIFSQLSPQPPDRLPSSQQALPPEESAFSCSEWTPTTSEESYRRDIAAIREAIAAGETYQVNYTLRLAAQMQGNAYAHYLHLLRTQQTGYCAYLNIGRYRLLSLSPELFFQRAGNHLVTRPMKGTRARGLWTSDDMAQAEALLHSEKDRAENIMIVDLLRNDLGRIALPGSVAVTNLFAVERYPTVWQMTSTIEADISPETTLGAIFGALFPCGSVTGAPKIQTMRHITALEAAPRNIYCGAIGYVCPNGNALFNVAIRTILLDTPSGEAVYGVGGGITWDSNAGDEYAETLTKAAILHQETPEFDVLETLRLENGVYSLLDRHLARMADTAAYFGFHFPVEEAARALEQTAQAYGAGVWRVRCRVTPAGEVLTEAYILEPSGAFPLPVVLAREAIDRNNRFLYHKTTYRAVYELHFQAAKQPAKKEGRPLYDALLWNAAGELTEFTTGNLVVEIEGRLWTPPVESGLLPGTLRAHHLENGDIAERRLTRDDLQEAVNLWLINSVRGWLPVTIINDNTRMKIAANERK